MSIRRLNLAQYLVDRGMVPDLARARAMILAGKVVVNDQRVDKSGYQVAVDRDQVRLKQNGRFVSRGGEKLERALVSLGWQGWLRGRVVLDVGASTGGFTDCCLYYGASHVTTVDVGQNQLAWKLRDDERVECIEKTDVRDFCWNRDKRPDLLVGDLSFISLATVASDIRRLAGERNILLLKPQFEVPREKLPPGGVVQSEELREYAIDRVSEAFSQSGIRVDRIVPSELPGRSGNIEFFVVFPGP